MSSVLRRCQSGLLDTSIETFTIEFNHLARRVGRVEPGSGSHCRADKIQLDLTGKLVPQIETLMASDAKQKPSYQAAMFYDDHDHDLSKASQWVDAAIAQRDAHYIEYLKAKILAKQGDKEGAIVAKRSTELWSTPRAPAT